MSRIYGHGIGGGWDVRHEGCAARCCEVRAEIVSRAQFPVEDCGGCGAPIGGPPEPMEFDRGEPCECHADVVTP